MSDVDVNIDEGRQGVRDKTREFRIVALTKIEQAEVGLLEARWHRDSVNNPHGDHKDKMGLDLVENFPLATDDELEDGVSGERYLTVDMLGRALEAHKPADDVNLLIGKPTVLSPTEGATGVPRVPVIEATSFTFNDQVDLTFERREYEVDLAGGDFTAPLFSWRETHDGGSTLPGLLDYLGDYQIRVRDRVTEGTYSDWSTPVTFKVMEYVIYPVNFTYPATGAGIERHSSIRWQSETQSDPEERYTLMHYRLQFSYTSDFSDITKEVLVPTTSHQITDDLNWEVEVFARVRPEWSDTPRVPAWSSTLEFTIDAYQTKVLRILSPGNGEGFSKGSSLIWTPITEADPEGLYTPTHIQIQYSEASDFSNAGSIHVPYTADNRWRVDGRFEYEKRYYFRIRPIWAESVSTPWSYPINLICQDEDLLYIVTPTVGVNTYQLDGALKAHDGGMILYHKYVLRNGDGSSTDPLGVVEWRKADGSKVFYKSSPTDLWATNYPSQTFPRLICWCEDEGYYLASNIFYDVRSGSPHESNQLFSVYPVDRNFNRIPDKMFAIARHVYGNYNFRVYAFYLGGRVYVAHQQYRTGGYSTSKIWSYISELNRDTFWVDAGNTRGCYSSETVSDGQGNYRAHGVSLLPVGHVPVGSPHYPTGLLAVSYTFYSESRNVRHNEIRLINADFSGSDNNNTKWAFGQSGRYDTVGHGYSNISANYPISIRGLEVMTTTARFTVSTDFIAYNRYPQDIKRANVDYMELSGYLSGRVAPLGVPAFARREKYLTASSMSEVGETPQREVRGRYLRATSAHPQMHSYVVDPQGENKIFGSIFYLDQPSEGTGFVDWYNRPPEVFPDVGEFHPYTTNLKWQNYQRRVPDMNSRTYSPNGYDYSTVSTGFSLYVTHVTAAKNLAEMALAVIPVPTQDLPDFLK